MIDIDEWPGEHCHVGLGGGDDGQHVLQRRTGMMMTTTTMMMMMTMLLFLPHLGWLTSTKGPASTATSGLVAAITDSTSSSGA
jgi:hypothetical protein